MRTHRVLFFLLTTSVLVLQNFGGCAQSESPEFQKTVDAIRSLQPTDIPDHLTEEYNAVKTGEEFDMNDYFSVLTHLSMEEGYVLDYVYLYDWAFGGRPIVYVRRADQEPFLNYEEYEKAQELIEQVDDVFEFVSIVMYGDSSVFDNKIRIDGTKEGFFEYVVLQLMGEQFYLAWHANYDDATIICDRTGIEGAFNEISRFGGESLSSASKQKARNLDLCPVIEFKDDVVTVTVMVFTKWAGFVRDSFTIKRDFPHTIVDRDWEIIVEYECGVEF